MKKLYVILFSLGLFLLKAQAPMTFTATPDSAGQTPRPGSTGTFQINYTGGVYTNSSYYSICCNNSKSSALHLYRFNFNIPSTASITGITASYSTTAGNGGPTNYKIDSLCLTNNFIKTGNYKRDSVNGPGGTYTNGGMADTWGALLTPSLVNSPHFGFRIHLDTYGINTTVLGAFTLVIHYTLPAGINEATDELAEPQVYCSNKQLIVRTNFGDKGKICIYALTGKKIAEYETRGEELRTDLNTLDQGIYLYQYSSRNRQYLGKFILD
jgi:hypothetical protein